MCGGYVRGFGMASSARRVKQWVGGTGAYMYVLMCIPDRTSSAAARLRRRGSTASSSGCWHRGRADAWRAAPPARRSGIAWRRPPSHVVSCPASIARARCFRRRRVHRVVLDVPATDRIQSLAPGCGLGHGPRPGGGREGEQGGCGGAGGGGAGGGGQACAIAPAAVAPAAVAHAAVAPAAVDRAAASNDAPARAPADAQLAPRGAREGAGAVRPQHDLRAVLGHLRVGPVSAGMTARG